MAAPWAEEPPSCLKVGSAALPLTSVMSRKSHEGDKGDDDVLTLWVREVRVLLDDGILLSSKDTTFQP